MVRAPVSDRIPEDFEHDDRGQHAGELDGRDDHHARLHRGNYRGGDRPADHLRGSASLLLIAGMVAWKVMLGMEAHDAEPDVG